MRRLFVFWLACAACLPAQQGKDSKDSKEAQEERDLEESVGEAGSSPIEYARALERHLRKYPDSKQREEIERVLVQAAIDSRNKRMLVTYGVPVVERGSTDPVVLEHVARALLDQTDKPSSEKALKYTRKLEEVLVSREKELRASPGIGKGGRLDDLLQRESRAQTFQARALGNLGNAAEAAAQAQRAWKIYPSAEAAREAGRWLEKAGQNEAAIEAYADAFSFNNAQKARDREKVAELYRKVKGSETGLGDLLLAAWDRTEARIAEDRQRLKEFDPNAGAVQPFDFTLGGLKGSPLPLATLKGKVTVLDFWATWCRPCRAQHPLYEQVRARFKDRDDVVFLAVNTDDDRAVVEPFLQAQKWDSRVYFEDGLQSVLRINSIPTTVILNRQGTVVNRMVGYIPERFVEMLAARIEEALTEQEP